ncbi:hypothetical protein LTR56_006226 [Elasticomyces elasticus]|nr:hypothetical protein LTR56_006226 [Elasticomyces elasticus]KAK3666565.1 hypothetical protein LTR22_002509 [Elasticomyces elasticus]KAK4928302.1 hypothetical protein LTR49_004979 [Elasticomyces elasticus]KAK5763865.1 hypothetical protein LTS12_005983 [Elasticomyces elasticus]
MDHLVKRHRAYLFPSRVQFLCTDDPYVGGDSWQDWANYAERNGRTWNGHQYGRSQVPEHNDQNSTEIGQQEGGAPSSSLDASSHNAFIQRWLWLGLLEEVTTIKINQADFVITSDPLGRPLAEHEEVQRLIRRQLLAAGIADLPDIPDELDSIPPRPILTTLKLNEHLLAWKAKMGAMSSEERSRNAKTSRHLLTLAYGLAERMCKSWNGSFALDEPLPISGPLSTRGEGIDQTIILSIFVLIETLKEATMHATENPYRKIDDYYPAQAEILIRRFKKAGWCPNRILWATSLGVCTSYVLSSSVFGDKADQHEGCTEDVCRSNYVDESTYKTRHVFLSCDDPSFSSESPDSASRIVADGGIPIVYFDGTKLQVIPFTEQELGFTAISHVWSGGLGNVRENALPECQLERLQRTVDQLNLLKASRNTDSSQSTPNKNQLGAYQRRPSGDWDSLYPEAPYMRKFSQGFHVQTKYYFWIDTLCVPLRPANLRRAAVRRIAEVFHRAAQVLLIDANVRLSSPPGTKPRITLYRVAAPEIIEVPDTSTNEGLLVDLASSN